MIIQCPECVLQVSDKAIACPHCGYPMKTDIENITEPRKIRKTNRRRRLPNGFGQISELKGRRLRKPFRAMVTVGKTEFGRPICKLLQPCAYFSSYIDAYTALVEYNRKPYDVNLEMTMAELYKKWSTEYFENLENPSSIRNIIAAWSYCSAIYDLKVSEIRARHIKYCVEEGTANVKGKEKPSTATFKPKIKSMFNNLMDYAVEYELADKNYARIYKIPGKNRKMQEKSQKEHISFTDDEMTLLWQHADDMLYVDVVLIQCYSGWRPQELGKIKLFDVDLKEWSFTGGMKTDAGFDRVVPIHSKIRHLVERKYKEAQSLDSEYLFNCVDDYKGRGDRRILTYDKFRKRFIKIRNELKLDSDHRAHDPRVQFVTMAKRYNVDEYAIKYMVGHVITDVTEKVYTKREFSWLKTEIEKIK